MLGDVVQRFLHHAVNGRFHFRRHPADIVRDRDPGLDARALGQVLGFLADGGNQSQLLQHQRREAADDAPDALDGAIDDFQQLLDFGFAGARA